MSKAILELEEMPVSCYECPFRYKDHEMSLGRFAYQKMFRCKFEPEDTDADDIYLNEVMESYTRKLWCPLKEVED